jgi:hypothetical protein
MPAIDLGKLQLDYAEMVKAAKAVDGVGASLGNLDKTSKKIDQTTTSTARLTDKLGKLSSFGRDLRQAGSFLGNDTLTAIGGVADGFGDVAQSIDAIVKQKGSLGKVLGGLGAVVGGVGIGSQIYDATIGRIQGTNTGEILDRIGQLIAAGFNVDTLKVQAQQAFIEQQKGVEFGTLQKGIKNIGKSRLDLAQEMGIYTGPRDEAGMKEALRKTEEYLKTAKDALPGEVDYKLQAVVIAAGLREELKRLETERSLKSQTEARAASAVQYMNRAGGIATAFAGMARAGSTFENSKAGAAQKYQNALAFISQEVAQKRLDLAKSYNADTLALDKQYYAQRQELAQQYGIETARAEEDHQRSIQRLTQDHGKRIQKLAESRDALAIEDEVDAYKTERQRAEEDYQVAARRRNEDYANQLAQLDQAHREQEAERRAQYAQQLVDLQKYADDRRTQETIEYGQLLKDIVQAFVDARNAFAAQMQTTNTTNNTANVNQTINAGQGTYMPQAIKQATYEAISEVFTKARQ